MDAAVATLCEHRYAFRSALRLVDTDHDDLVSAPQFREALEALSASISHSISQQEVDAFVEQMPFMNGKLHIEKLFGTFEIVDVLSGTSQHIHSLDPPERRCCVMQKKK